MFLKFISTTFTIIRYYDCVIGNQILFWIIYPTENEKVVIELKTFIDRHSNVSEGLFLLPRYQLSLWIYLLASFSEMTELSTIIYYLDDGIFHLKVIFFHFWLKTTSNMIFGTFFEFLEIFEKFFGILEWKSNSVA